MMTREQLQGILDKLLNAGADKASLSFSSATDEEFNVVYKDLNLLRTVETNSIGMMVIKDQKQASTRLNQFDTASIDKAVGEVMQAVENSNPDPAFDISPKDEGSWTDGDLEPDVEKVILRLQEFISVMKERYPEVQFDAGLTHSKGNTAYLNSNGVWLEHISGSYGFNTMFTAKKDGRMSSFNYTGYAIGDLDKNLLEINFTEELIRQSTGQTITQPVPANFTGDVIMAPFLAMDLLGTFIASNLGDGGLLMKSSKFPDHLGQKILDAKISVVNDPLHPEICQRGRYTGDGFRSVSAPIIENGVLRNYPISLYAANKCGKPRTTGPCSNLIVPTGDRTLAEMIASVQEGILCMRASFGSPNANGDLSAVIKNSYYIKDGKVLFPISETMLSANINEMLNNVEALSKEAFNTGDSIFPYLQIKDIFVSRK